MDAFIEHGHVALSIETDLAGVRERMAGLAEMGIDLDAITQPLMDDGVASFAEAFEGLMSSVEGKRDRFLL